jgi:hypothetical protein
MRRRITSLVAAVTFFAAAAAAVAQNADPNTGGPTKNDLRLRVTEPAEGATISGTSVRVAVEYNKGTFADSKNTHFGDPNFPQPRFEVYFDNNRVATLKGTETNTATIENVTPGPHKVAVVALNVSGEVIDRKEFGITTTATVVAESTTTSTMATAPAPAPPASAPAPAPSTSYEPAPAPAAPVETTLPTTGSPFPRMAAAGLALVAAGILIGRKVR